MPRTEKQALELASFGLETLNNIFADKPPKVPWISHPSHTNRWSYNDEKEKVFTRGWASTTNVAIGSVTDDKDAPILVYYTMCYGCMNNSSEVLANSTHIFACIPHPLIRNKGKKLKDMKGPLHWLINDSPWASACITKNAEEAYMKGIVVDGKAPANMSFGVLLSFKNIYNANATTLKIWGELIAKGCHPHIAFVQLWGRGVYLSRVSTYSNALHTAAFNVDPIIRFLKHEPTYLTDSYYVLNKYRALGPKVPGSGVGDATVSHMFMTVDELVAYNTYITNLSGSAQYDTPLSRELVSLIPRKPHTGERDYLASTMLNLSEVQDIFIKWADDEFSAYY